MTLTLAPPLPLTSLRRTPLVKPSLWNRLRRIDPILALASSLLGTVLVAVGIGRAPAVGGDEGIYTNHAYAVMHGHLTPYTYTYDHPFFGWAQLALTSWVSQLLHIGGDLSVVNARAVMVLYTFATLLLTYGVARRLNLRPAFATVAVLLLGLSPLFVVDARQVFLDNIALPWVLGALYVALNPARRQWAYGLAGLFMGVGILSKETVLLLVPAVLYVVWTKAYKPIRLMSIAAFVTFGAVVVLIYPLFALLRNELFAGSQHVSLWTNGVMYQLATRAGSGALWQSGSERRDLLDGWLFYDHWLVYGGAAAAVLTLFSKRLRVIGIAYILWALPIIKPGGYLPAMYVIAALPFAALGMASILDVTQNFLRRLKLPVVAAGVLVGALTLTVAYFVGASYLPGDRAVTTSAGSRTVVAAQEQALAYVTARAATQDNILTDDAFWTDLVRAGHGSVTNPWSGAISYYQFDLDASSSAANLPHAWQDISWVVLTDAMQENIKNLGLVKLGVTLQHATAVATFGSGDAMVQILKVQATPYNSNGR